MPGGQIVHDQLEARDEALLDRDGGDVMRERAVAVEHGALVVMPVVHHRAAVREQRVVRVQHAFGHAGRARR